MLRVLVVARSALVRKTLREILDGARGLEVVDTAPNAAIAGRKHAELDAEALVLDLGVAERADLGALRDLRSWAPLPTVVVAAEPSDEAPLAQQARSLGASAWVQRPGGPFGTGMRAAGDRIVAAVLAAAAAPPPARAATLPVPRLATTPKILIDEVLPLEPPPLATAPPVICIGASTGGTIAIEQILTALPADLPGVAIVQHMPAGFTEGFAQRLDRSSALDVIQAVDGAPLRAGSAVVAPGDQHLTLERTAGGYVVRLSDGPRVNRHRPAVDMLFRSAASCAGGSAIAALLTGMGDDGARGLKDLCDRGAWTIAQDEASCVVYGMPGEAVALGAARQVVPLSEIAGHLTRLGGVQQRSATLLGRNLTRPTATMTTAQRRATTRAGPRLEPTRKLTRSGPGFDE